MRIKRGIKVAFVACMTTTCAVVAVCTLWHALPRRPMFRMDGQRFVDFGAIEREPDLLALQPWVTIGSETTGFPKEDGQAYGIRPGTQIYAVWPDSALYQTWENLAEDDGALAVYRSDDTWRLCAPDGDS